MNNQMTEEQLKVKVINTMRQLKIDTINLIKSKLNDRSYINTDYLSLMINDVLLAENITDINICEDMLFIDYKEKSTAIKIDKINNIYYSDLHGDSIYMEF